MGKILDVENLVISFRTNNGKVQAVRDISFSMDKNSSGKTVAQMAFNTQAIGGGWNGNGGDGWLRYLEFMPDKKTIKAKTFSPLFAISPSTRHLAWKHDERSEFTFILE